MGGRRLRWPLAVVAGIALVLAGAGVAATLVRWNGSLGYDYGNGVGLPVRAGQPFSVGMISIRPARRVRIESVRLHRASRGLELVGAIAYPGAGCMQATDRQFPPRCRASATPAVGLVVPAHARAQLYVGVRAARGVFHAYGVDVTYREHWHGLELRRRTHTGVEIQGCAAVTSAAYPRCPVPKFSWG